MVVGGTVSVITGGKFANGAKTAAFQYLFNEVLHANSFYEDLEEAYSQIDVEDVVSVTLESVLSAKDNTLSWDGEKITGKGSWKVRRGKLEGSLSVSCDTNGGCSASLSVGAKIIEGMKPSIGVNTKGDISLAMEFSYGVSRGTIKFNSHIPAAARNMVNVPPQVIQATSNTINNYYIKLMGF